MVSRKLICVAVLAALGPIAASARPVSPIAALIEVRPDGQRTVFSNVPLDRRDRVIAQELDSNGGLRCCVRLSPGATLRRTDVSDELTHREVLAYALPAVPKKKARPFVGAALVFRSGHGGLSHAERSLLSGEGGTAFPVACLSSEGAHLLQLTDTKPQVHLYMHLDYAVEPTCPAGLLR